MKATIIGLALCVASTSALARASSNDEDAYAAVGIVTPNVATDAFRTYGIARDKDGNLLICPDYRIGVQVLREGGQLSCRDSQGRNAWVRPANVPPKGKTYVGFRLTPSGYYEFYWK